MQLEDTKTEKHIQLLQTDWTKERIFKIYISSISNAQRGKKKLSITLTFLFPDFFLF